MTINTDVLSAALDSGVAISIIVIFFALQFPQNGAVSFYFSSFLSHQLHLKTVVDRTNQHSSLVGVSKIDSDFMKATFVEKKTNLFAVYRNTVPFTGADGLGTPVRALAPGATFG